MRLTGLRLGLNFGPPPLCASCSTACGAQVVRPLDYTGRRLLHIWELVLLLCKLQSVLNVVAHLICHLKSSDHIMDALVSLH